jgi:hypothetical protein
MKSDDKNVSIACSSGGRRGNARILHDPGGVHGGVGVDARFARHPAGVAESGDTDEGAVVDEGATVVALARVHGAICGSCADLIGSQVALVERAALVGINHRHVRLHQDIGGEAACSSQPPSGHLGGRAGHRRGALRTQFDGGGVDSVQHNGFARNQLREGENLEDGKIVGLETDLPDGKVNVAAHVGDDFCNFRSRSIAQSVEGCNVQRVRHHLGQMCIPLADLEHIGNYSSNFR